MTPEVWRDMVTFSARPNICLFVIILSCRSGVTFWEHQGNQTRWTFPYPKSQDAANVSNRDHPDLSGSELEKRIRLQAL